MLEQKFTTYHNKIGLRKSFLYEDLPFDGMRMAGARTGAIPSKAHEQRLLSAANGAQQLSVQAKIMVDRYLPYPQLPTDGRGASGLMGDGHPVEMIEKNTSKLRELNSQLALCIERVHLLETTNKMLKLEQLCVDRNVDSYNLMIQDMLLEEISAINQMIDRVKDQHQQVLTEIEQRTETLSELKSAINSPDNENYKANILEQQNKVSDSMAKSDTAIHTMNRKYGDIQANKQRHKKMIEQLTQKLLSIINGEKDIKENVIDLRAKQNEMTRRVNILKRVYANNLSKVNEDPLKVPRLRHSEELPKMIEEIREDHERQMQQTERTLREDLVYEYNVIVERLQKRHSSSLLPQPVSTQDHAQEMQLQSSIHEIQRSVSEKASTNIALHDTLQKINQMIFRDNKHAEAVYRKKKAYAADLEKKLDSISKHCQELMKANEATENEIARYNTLLNGTTKFEGLQYVAHKANK